VCVFKWNTENPLVKEDIGFWKENECANLIKLMINVILNY